MQSYSPIETNHATYVRGPLFANSFHVSSTMSRQQTFTNIIHLRDFVDAITDDPTRENAPNYVEIQTDLNIFEEDGFQHPNIATDPIRIRIHTYLTQEQRELYLPAAFIYADGRFSTALSTDGTLEISMQTLSLRMHAAPKVPASSG